MSGSDMASGNAKAVAKVFIRSGQGFIFSRKRKPHAPDTDDRLEMLGGKLEEGESPREALIRELFEEETSGTLGRLAESTQTVHKEVEVSNQLHFIFTLDTGNTSMDLLHASQEESRGFVRLAAETIQNPQMLSAILERFTPKTRSIFEAMGMTPPQ